MVNNKTVLVLGAGASMPYGFPSGQGLIDLICDDGSGFMKNVAEGAEVSNNEVIDFIKDLGEADPESIDVFLGNNPGFEKVGKAAIAATLLPRESESGLKSKWKELRRRGENSKFGGHWYKYLANLLLADTSFEEFDQNKLSIITFNYDRSLEHYLFTTLQASFHKKGAKECGEKLNAIKIIHIYGQLGYLPWQTYNGNYIPFGSKLISDERQLIPTISRAINCIKTMTEDSGKDDSHIKLARQLLSEAAKIYFLGFGFHPINLKILGIESLEKSKDIHGTSLGLSYQLKVELGRFGISSLIWDKRRMNPRGLYDEDVYEFLYKHAILD
jgi:hypothetical protein